MNNEIIYKRRLWPSGDKMILTLEEVGREHTIIKQDDKIICEIKGGFLSTAIDTYKKLYNIYRNFLMPSYDEYNEEFIDFQIKQNLELYDAIEEKYKHIEDKKERQQKCANIYKSIRK